MHSTAAQHLLTTVELHPDIFKNGVLVVDDSDLQRSVVVEVLKSMGLNLIYEAANGEDALRMLRTPGIDPVIMLVDLHMPEMDGIELIQEVATVKPHISVIIISGADTKLLETLGSLVCACEMSMLGALPKPLNGQNLLRSMQRYHYDVDVHTQTNSANSISAQDLKRAIRLGHIQPHYQPQISLKHARVVGFEALARWRDPVKGFVATTQFIELATETGLIKELTQHMLDTVLADMNAWNQLDIFPIISLNVPVTLLEDRSFANQIIRSVKNANISPTKIRLEITESALMKDQVVALATIGRLKLQGFGFSIDDYGTGFSSMQQLSRIAFDELKIDRSFVSRATESEHMLSILRSAVDTGQRLGLITVAEGVETIEELNLLRNMNCDEIQGYLFARPMPACDVLPWLNESSSTIIDLCRHHP